MPAEPASLKEIAHRPQKDIIAQLEELLEDAKAGRVVGFAFITTNPGGQFATGWSGDVGWQRNQFLGAITYLQARFLAGLFDVEGRQ